MPLRAVTRLDVVEEDVIILRDVPVAAADKEKLAAHHTCRVAGASQWQRRLHRHLEENGQRWATVGIGTWDLGIGNWWATLESVGERGERRVTVGNGG